MLINIIGISFILLFTVGPLLQIGKLITIKRCDSLSKLSIWANLIGQFFAIIYNNYYNAGGWIILNSIFAIITNIILLYLIKRYA